MTLKTRALIGLVSLSLVDTVIPIPIVGLTLIYVMIQKPPWFQEIVAAIYGEDKGEH